MLDKPHTTKTRNAVTIRAATAADVTETARVWQAAWLDGHRDHVSPALLAARDAAYFSDRTAAVVESTLLASSPDRGVVGMAIIDADELVQLAVAHSVRRRGVGGMLLQAVEARVAATHDEAWLAVVPGNSRARSLYAKHGWRDAGGMTYQAPGPAGPIPVLVRRYVKTVRGGARTTP